jgi:hypothetical protein
MHDEAAFLASYGGTIALAVHLDDGRYNTYADDTFS